MTAKAEQIVAEALELSPTVRAFVAEKLIESLDVSKPSELSAEWKKEVQRRCQEVDQGTAKLSEADAVFKRAFASLE